MSPIAVESTAARPTEITVGVLGAGNVGAALIGLIDEHGDAIEARTGIRLRVGRVAVRSMSRERGVALDPEIVTTDAAGVVSDDDVDLVVELIGGIEPARELIATALAAGKPVVTANKELLANVGSELADAAEAAGVDLLYEAAVAGGIPFIRPLRESLVGEPISRIMGIVNGTTNYILSQMDTEGVSYADALASAQSLGYAERDPTADVEGFDAAAKAAIIASIAFGARVVAGDVAHEGISDVSAADISFARRLGYTIKLLAICERFDDGSIAARVHPAMVSADHPLSGVRDSYNAVFVEGDVVGNLMFYGRGAGGGPTASAVLGDVIDAAANLARGTHASVGHLAKAQLRSVDDLSSPYYVNVEVRDRPGVLAEVASVFGSHGVSIRSMEQEGLGDDARIVFITHDATERDVQACLSDLRRLDTVARVASVLRVVAE
ncbi:homoserine dehydrogenase [Candidatus Neomicrothrix sp.]|uniref:homoserine dehydrogenase n=1 Tax=Candidatus Neomicrothrix sp. TaxID=2719034 RepID=UPI002596629C|nr:homoserine dehydrogenase [Candidatus Microthrix sp.]HMS47193.1 homoserine dehydrogenase [Candidatus Microthrix sp.]